ncbi:unnamed protein product, partial [Ectocarpus sp. 6 AP-2014]
NDLYLYALYEVSEVDAAGANLSLPDEDKTPHSYNLAVNRERIRDPHLSAVYGRRACSRIDPKLHRRIEDRVLQRTQQRRKCL